VPRYLFAHFSWRAFCVAEESNPLKYSTLVQNGTHKPSHLEFAKYIQWVLVQSRCEVIYATCSEITSLENGRWQVKTEVGIKECDGVVITGNGHPKTSIDISASPVHNAKNFWSARHNIVSTLDSFDDPRVIIIGSGGAAAAIAGWFTEKHLAGLSIQIIGKEPTLYARHTNYFDDRFFGDDDEWIKIPIEAKAAYVKRVTRGVVWASVLDILSTNRQFDYHMGEIIKVKQGADDMLVCVDKDLKDAFEAHVVIDATGFDQWWFLDQLSPTLRASLSAVGRDELQKNITQYLDFEEPIPTGLHVPSSGWIQGPAATNLMALGWVANRILTKYI
jgi:mycobactin lysine-N-oxygenase